MEQKKDQLTQVPAQEPVAIDSPENVRTELYAQLEFANLGGGGGWVRKNVSKQSKVESGCYLKCE